MLPTLKPTEEFLVDGAAYLNRLPQIGDVVALKDPRLTTRIIIKRVSDIRPNRTLYLLGDNPDHSTDSREFGAVSAETLIGKVVCKFNPDPNNDKTSLATLLFIGATAIWLYRKRAN